MVKHIHSGEPLQVDRYALAQIIIMTIADFSEQLFSWQVRGGGVQVGYRLGTGAPCEGRKFMQGRLLHFLFSLFRGV